jgi:hypothetical protein
MNKAIRREAGVRIVLSRGNLNNGANSGPRNVNANNAPGNANSNVSARLNLTLINAPLNALPLGKTYTSNSRSGSVSERPVPGQALAL